jgi:DNA polymerase
VTRVVLDVETASTVALPTVGAAAYFEHPETRVTCAAYAVDTGPVITWRPGWTPPVFPENAIFVAHNYLFELHCWDLMLAPKYHWLAAPRPDQWSCTMARALYHALPAGLEGVCDALHLVIKKDASARKLMLQMARPRTTEPLTTWWHETDLSKLAELMSYCVQDVEAERLLDQVLPELSPFERQVFLVDGKINLRGLAVDEPLVRRMTQLATHEVALLDQDMRNITRSRVRSCAQVGMLQTWLAFDQNCHVPDLQKHSVAEALIAVPHAPPLARAALEVRQEAARASTKKLNAMTAGRSRDGRVRGLFQYGGAGRTLRWAGRRVQPQNFPRGTIKGVERALDLIQSGVGPEDLNMLFEDSALGVLASCLRGCFVASPGHRLVVGDLAQIEARVVCYLSGQQDVLDVFASGADTYTYTARQQGSDSRQFGKVLILACGFGMGPDRFQATAQTYGITLDPAQAFDAVHNWRENNDQIVHLWWDIGNAAARIARSQDGTSIQVRGIELRRSKRAMKIILPSGRALIYHHIGLQENDRTGRSDLVFMGVDPKTKRWTKQRTYGGKLVENITQATARDVMAWDMVQLNAMGVPLVGTVHDELIAETPVPLAQATLDRMLTTMRTTPPWAPGLPLAAQGWVGARYRKE